jgi:hypothetical protein
MKKIISEFHPEEAKFYCDNHPDRECFSRIECMSWYGSKYDLNQIEIHLCDECLEQFYKYVKETYKTEPKEIEI